MTDAEDKEKAEKLAAAKKKFEQLKKQKAKKASAKKEDIKDDVEPVPPKGDEKPSEEVKEASDGSKGTAPRESDISESGESQSVETEPSNRSSHARQPSLSVQSKMRSSSFRRASLTQPPLSPSAGNIKSPTLPPISPNGETMPEIYRKQALRIEELEKENRRLERDCKEGEARWLRTEEELEELRVVKGDMKSLRDRADKVQSQESEIEKFKSEVAALQRQNSHLQSASKARHASSPSQANLNSPSGLVAALESKSTTIETMEMEISNLRAQLTKNSSASTAHTEQVEALEEQLAKSRKAADSSRKELADLRKNLERASERAIKEGGERTSAETQIRSLEREVSEGKKVQEDLRIKCQALEKKINTLTTLHRESDTRSQARSRERDRFEREAAELRKRLAAMQNENLGLKEEKARWSKRETQGIDDEGVDELEDEERKRLQSKVRGLEAEVFDLRRGLWREKRQELQGGTGGLGSPGARDFDDVDLGPSPRRGSMAKAPNTFTDVLNSGLTALTGGGGVARERERDVAEEEDDDDDDDGFDEEAFRMAHEEEARKRVERVRELKRGLKDWEGWRVDLVEMRRGGGGGVGVGEIFEV